MLWDAEKRVFHAVSWKRKTGYNPRFPEEHTIDVLVVRFRTKSKADQIRMVSKLLSARLVMAC